MLDIAFTDSFAGTLKWASHSEKRIGNVAFLNLLLDMGDLTEGVFSDKRLDQIDSFFEDEWLEKDRILYEKEYLLKDKAIIEKVITAALEGESVRIWYSLSGWEYCAFLYMADMLDQVTSTGQISAICLQNDKVAPPKDIYYWGQLEEKEVSPFFAAEEIITKERLRRLAAEWRRISAEPWPLRTMTEGFLLGVPEEFFDSAIESFIPKKGEIKPYRVIGEYFNALGAHASLGVVMWRLTKILRSSKYRLVRRETPGPGSDYYTLGHCVFEAK